MYNNNFDKIAKKYYKEAILQKQIADDLFNFIFNGQNFEKIVDLGCGTGFLGEKFLDYSNKICFVDLHKEMLDECIKASNAEYIKLDFNDNLLDILDKNTTVVSSMSLQWATNLAETLKIIAQNSASFGFAIPIVGTFFELYKKIEDHDINIKKFNFYTQKQIMDILAIYNCEYFVGDYQLQFNNIKDLFRHLKQIGVNYPSLSSSFSKIKKLLQNKDAILYNYNVLFIKNKTKS